MKKNFMKYSILIGAGMLLGVVASNIGNVFGAQYPNDPIEAEKIVNTACIEYTTPSGTGVKCDDVVVTLKTGNAQQHEYFIKKRQKTGGMANFTTSQITVQSGEYIQYKVDFGSITGDCRNGTIKDILPSCVRYVSSEIYGVTGLLSFSTGNGYIQYTDFRLNSGTSGYILVTGQIIENTTRCKDVKQDVNTGAFKCNSLASEWIYSSVVAIRTGGGGGGGGSGSEVIFTKDGNKDQMVPGETGLIFTLKVINNGPNPISGIVIDDIWPNNSCIIFDGWTGQYWQRLGNNYAWQYNGLSNNGTLRSGGHATLKLYAKINDDPNCVGYYINTGKLTYQEGGKEYTLYDDYPFIVVTGGVGYDVSITKTADHNKVHHGQSIQYYIDYENIGSEPLINYTIIDNWPYDDVDFISSNPEPLPNDGKTITWFFTGSLAPGSGRRITINAKVK